MSWPEYCPPYLPYPTGIGQILGLVGCIAYAVQLFGQAVFIIWRHTHRRSPDDRLLKMFPPAGYGLWRAWAGMLLAVSNLGGNMLEYNIALVAQPHLLILFGLFEFAARHGMDGQHKIALTIVLLIVIGAVEVLMLRIVDGVPAALFALFVPVAIGFIAAAGGLAESVKERHEVHRASVGLMLTAVAGGVICLVAVLYTPWYSLELGYTGVGVYSLDILLWMCALLSAWHVKFHPKHVDGNSLDMQSV